MALKKGICKNYDNCSLADNKEIQEVEPTEFKCAECGKDLHELPKDTSTIPKPGPNIPLIVGIALVVVGLVVGGYFLIRSNKAKKAEKEKATRIADSIRRVQEQQRIADSIRFAEALKAQQAEEEARLAEEQRIADSLAAIAKKPGNTQPATGGSGSSNWNGVANYSGPMQGGKPNGIGGKLTFKSNYQLDLKDGKGTKLDIKAGETIENTKFENGKLRQGELHRKDGSRKWFNI